MHRRWQDYNLYLLMSVLVLLGFGVAMVYSTTIGTNYPGVVWTYTSPIGKHLIWLALGFAGMILLTVVDYHNLQLLARPFYLVTIVILGFILAAGKIGGGAQSWLLSTENGQVSGQPAELAKLLLIITLAAWWAGREERSSSWWVQGGALLLAGVPLLLVLAQPDLGTAMVIGTVWLVMAWSAGMRWKQLGLLIVIAVPLLYIGWNYVLEDYQQGRLMAFVMDQEQINQLPPGRVREAVEAVFYNVDASRVAVGNGGLLGQGLMNGIQSQRDFLPVDYTDFIFAVTAEELGFVGAAAMLGFIGLVLWQAITVAGRARDLFGRLLAMGVFAMLLIHTLENVGMNMGLMPVTGIPLPFISYGGSFTVTVLTSIGLLQSIDMRRRTLVF